MKKLILLTAFLSLVKWGEAQVNMGFRAGLNAGIFEVKNESFGKYDVTPRFNLILGLDADIPFSTVFSFQTGIGLVQKSIEIDRTQEMEAAHIHDSIWSTLYRMNFLEIPLFLTARAETDFGGFFLGIGPTLSLGVGGQVNVASKHINGTGGLNEYDTKLKWDGKFMPTTKENLHHFKRFDMGLGAKFAYRLPHSKVTFTFSYNKGLRNLATDPKMDFKTSYVGISFGFSM